MVRAALQTRGRLNRGPRKGVTIIPAASVVLMSCLAMLPVVAYRGGDTEPGRNGRFLARESLPERPDGGDPRRARIPTPCPPSVPRGGQRR